MTFYPSGFKTLDDDLVKKVEAIAKELQTTRSAFTRDALREAVQQYNVRRQELKHRKGYAVILSMKKSSAFGKKNKIGGMN